MCATGQYQQRTRGVPRQIAEHAAIQQPPQRAVAAGPDDQQIGLGGISAEVLGRAFIEHPDAPDLAGALSVSRRGHGDRARRSVQRGKGVVAEQSSAHHPLL